MPRATFSGVRLQLIGDLSVVQDYPDVVSLETFLKIKESVDAVVSPKIALDGKEPEGKGGK